VATSAASSVEEYLAELPPERAEVVDEVRRVVLEHLPEGVAEGMNFGMIAYEIPLERYPDTYNGQPLMYAALAAQKHHYALYLHSVYASDDIETKLRAAYSEAGIPLDMGKSCVRFKRLDQFLPEAIGEAVGACTVEEYIDLYERSRRR
jgi:hypothetical protein